MWKAEMETKPYRIAHVVMAFRKITGMSSYSLSETTSAPQLWFFWTAERIETLTIKLALNANLVFVKPHEHGVTQI